MSSPIPSAPATPRLLVSVRDAAEAEIAAARGADLVDAKDPARGALGALPPDAVRAIVAAVAGRAATSAVAGEPADAGALAEAVAAMAATGVEFVKVAVGPALRREHGILARAARAAPGRLIAVLFAEEAPAPEDPAALRAAGFLGAMIDTAGKDGRRLTDHLDGARLAGFAAACRAQGLLSGLAGSLRAEDIAALAAAGPDYLGFRGGLCRGGDRRDSLDPARLTDAVARLRALRRRDAA
ncbi:(5-formylfuran-3-yl)methyl phosphate synthase [Methylobacterium nigriterrae]|uniref:(5-formylfuran-3-yl)methyl phosphate synthase n=1 Tax=Methylobacterium nigriterrae TaxID=3127512 RepID=UPI00301385B5